MLHIFVTIDLCMCMDMQPQMFGMHNAGEFSSCAAAPESFGFKDFAIGFQPNPLPYFGLNFTASSSGALPPSLLVTTSNALTLQGSFPAPTFSDVNGNLDIKDSGKAAGGAIIATSVFLRASGSAPFESPENNPVGVIGSQNGTVNPSCQQTAPASASPVKVDLGSNGGACVADGLSFVTQFANLSPSFPTNNFIELVDLVVCKANKQSGLLPK